MSGRRSRFRTIVIVFVLFALCLPFCPAAAAETAGAGTLRVRSSGCVFPGEYEAEVPYDDSFFLQDACVYHHELAQLSMGMSLAAFRWEDSAEHSSVSYIEDFFSEAGFTDCILRDYDKSPSLYTIASCIASKKITEGPEEFTLVAVAVCGGFYRREWASNVTLGSGERHEGFASAAELIENRVLGYLYRQHLNDSRIKLWISGFSRAAAVANLVGADLTDMGLVPASDLFVYTFATPRAARNVQGTYPNIFNIIGKMDVVPLMVPGSWGYRRYGTDLFTPAQETDSDYPARRERVKLSFEKLTGNPFWNNVGGDLQLHLFVAYLVYCMESPEIYAGYLEDSVAGMIESDSAVDLAREIRSLYETTELADRQTQEEIDAFVAYATEFMADILSHSGEISRAWVEDAKRKGNVFHEHCPEIYMAWMLSSDDPDEIFSGSEDFLHIRVSGSGSFAVTDRDAGALVFAAGDPAAALEALRAADPGLLPDYAGSCDFYSSSESGGDQILLVPCDRNYDVWFIPDGAQELSAAVALSGVRKSDEEPLRPPVRLRRQQLQAAGGQAVCLANTEDCLQGMDVFLATLDGEGNVVERSDSFSPTVVAEQLRLDRRTWTERHMPQLLRVLPTVAVFLLLSLITLLICLPIRRRRRAAKKNAEAEQP